jgi:NAD(P)-dependent dehydrogenase (short-subunit alcohol dehydrogenase family)
MEPTDVVSGRYSGQSVLITGGANGLGYASAERLAAEGATVGLIDLEQERLDVATGQLRDRGHDAHGYVADVSDEGQTEAAVRGFHEQTGRVDALVMMAAIYPEMPFDELPLEVWQRVNAVNLDGAFIGTKAVLPIMKDQQYGRIVSIASETFLIGFPPLASYIASKAGVIGLTRVLAREGGPHGITANCILPGLIGSEQNLAREGIDALFDMIVSTQCIPRRGEPEDIADAVAWLGSRGASFITGQSIAVGGGDRFL